MTAGDIFKGIGVAFRRIPDMVTSGFSITFVVGYWPCPCTDMYRPDLALRGIEGGKDLSMRTSSFAQFFGVLDTLFIYSER